MTGKQKFLSLILLGALTALGFLYFRDTSPPEIQLSPGAGAINHQAALALTVEDPGSGLKSVRVLLRSGDRETVLQEEQFPEGTTEWSLKIRPAKHRPDQGPMDITVEAVDRSYHNQLKGNRQRQTFSLEYDSKPPVVSVLSTHHNLMQGGSGLIVYQLGEEVQKTGMQIGDRFFPGYRLANGNWASLFTFPYDADPETTVPVLIALDIAGNEGRGKFFYRVRPNRFEKVRIDLDQGFLGSLYREFAGHYPDTTDPVQLFLKINRDLRQENRSRLPQIAAGTSSLPLWSGQFLRQRGKRTGNFGNRRSYYVDGKRIDQQTHLGIDIASVAAAPVQAANSGQVVWADTLGIYGQCVIIDHGLGLQTLYGHLSQITVSVGQQVTQGMEIARSGLSGIAAGDHLHFGVLVSGIPADPVEWWDPDWVRSHIADKLAIQP